VIIPETFLGEHPHHKVTTLQEIVMLGEGAFIIAGQLFKVGEVGALLGVEENRKY
jgi:hypothetical protein